jgi:hypothetical protein
MAFWALTAGRAPPDRVASAANAAVDARRQAIAPAPAAYFLQVILVLLDPPGDEYLSTRDAVTQVSFTAPFVGELFACTDVDMKRHEKTGRLAVS